MSDPKPRASLIRARMEGASQARLLIQMRHDSETGLRVDAQGRPLPAWFISEFRLTLDGRLLLAAQLGAGMGRDPQLELHLRGVKAGERLQLDWTDNRGAQRSDSATIEA